MRFGIYSNLTRDKNGKATLGLIKLLESKGLCFAVSQDLIALGGNHNYLDNASLAEFSDILIIFGGDGTILRIAKECIKYNCAIFAVNFGNVGFLTEIEYGKLAEAIDCIINGKVKYEKRAFIEIEYKNKKHYALNEIIIHRGTETKMIHLDITINGVLVDKLRADGLIISSPTGSTAYSLSAGGPIVTPDVNAFIVTPICAHSFYSRPFVVSQNNIIELHLSKVNTSASISVDGEEVGKMYINDNLSIKSSEYKVKFLRLDSYNFFDNIVQKLNYWKEV